MEQERYIDAEEYEGKRKQNITFRDIVLSHLKRISQYASVEFTGGYWTTKPFNVSGLTYKQKIYIQDSGMVYCNAIKFLYDILFDRFDDTMLKKGEAMEKKCKEVNDYRLLLRELCCFLNRKKYFEAGEYKE